MTGRITEWQPRFKARVAGVCEALEGLTSSAGQVFILGRLVVTGNAAATAANILGHERLFRVGFALSVIGVAFHIAWVVLFYDLFKPVGRRLSLLAAFVGLVVCAMQAVTCLLYLAPLLVLQGGSSLGGLTTEQMQSLAMMFLKLNGLAFQVDLVFFGLWCVLAGYLIFRSTFLPRILGVLLMIDGLGWLTYISPPLGIQLFPFVAVASGLAEFPLQLWLIVKGRRGVRPDFLISQGIGSVRPERTRLLDDLGNRLGVRDVDRVTAADLDHRRPGALRHESLCGDGNHLVVRDEEIPTRLVLPRRITDRPAQGLDAPRHLRIGHERGFPFLDVAGEGRRELLPVEKEISVHGRQDRGHRRSRGWVLDERLHGLALVGGERGDVDETDHLRIVAGFGDYGTAVRMANENHGVILCGDHLLRGRDVVGVRLRRVLDDSDGVPVLLEDVIDALSTRAVDEAAMNEND